MRHRTEQAKVIDITARRSRERINGVVVPLGHMTVAELVAMERQCAERVEDAKTDLMIVSDYLYAARMRDGGAS